MLTLKQSKASLPKTTKPVYDKINVVGTKTYLLCNLHLQFYNTGFWVDFTKRKWLQWQTRITILLT